MYKRMMPLLLAAFVCIFCLPALAEDADWRDVHRIDNGADTAAIRAWAISLAEEGDAEMRMMIGDTSVAVQWEDNDAVAGLHDLARDGLTIHMSMYGGFEQVGDIGYSLPADDAQMTTEAGDIVLYSGDQLVVFYGSNSWSYTRLGRITDKTAEQMAALLANGDVTITLTLK